MAAANGKQTPTLVAVDVERKLWEEPYAFEFFQAVRLLENLLLGRNEVGRFAAPRQELVRFKQSTSLSFPSSDVLKLASREDGPPEMTVTFMGLVGIHGVLPRPYTELVLTRASSRDAVFREFLDLFHHRVVSLFYLAWRKYRLLERDTDQPNPLHTALAAMIGLGTKAVQSRQPFPDADLLYFAGLLAQQPRSAEALESALSEYFKIPVRVEQFIGGWYKLDSDALCTLDSSESETRQIGIGSVVGDQVWEPQAKVRLVLGPLSRKRYSDFLPAGKDHRALRSFVRFFSDEVDFEAQLVLKARKTPPCRLGKTGECGPRLGWLSWITTRVIDRNPADTIIPL